MNDIYMRSCRQVEKEPSCSDADMGQHSVSLLLRLSFIQVLFGYFNLFSFALLWGIEKLPSGAAGWLTCLTVQLHPCRYIYIYIICIYIVYIILYIY